MSLVTWWLIVLGVFVAFVIAFAWVLMWSMWKMEAESKG